jgi:hypothetical protein
MATIGFGLPATKAKAPGALFAYKLTPGESLRYKLSATIHGSLPLFDSPEPNELNATIMIVYVATPKTRLADGTMDVDFKVEKAELEVEKIPFPLEPEQAQQILNQSVSLAATGEVMKVRGGAPLPFGVSIPGVDPKRLYALLFPIVFQTKPVKTGDSWNFKSELLGGEGTKPVFTATVLPVEAAAPLSSNDSQAKPVTGKSAPNTTSPANAVSNAARLREEFEMAVDQKLDADKKPVTGDKPVHRTRTGKINGTGLFLFDQTRGRLTSGTVTIAADVHEDLVGPPANEDEPKQLISKVDAKVKVELLPPAIKSTKPAAKSAMKSGAGAPEKRRSPDVCRNSPLDGGRRGDIVAGRCPARRTCRWEGRQARHAGIHL